MDFRPYASDYADLLIVSICAYVYSLRKLENVKCRVEERKKHTKISPRNNLLNNKTKLNIFTGTINV